MFNDIKISPEAVALISAKQAFERDILPLEIKDNILHIGIPNKSDLKLINDVSFYTGYKIKAVEMPPDIILQKLKEIYKQSEIKRNGDDLNQDSMINESSNVEFVNQVIYYRCEK